MFINKKFKIYIIKDFSYKKINFKNYLQIGKKI